MITIYATIIWLIVLQVILAQTGSDAQAIALFENSVQVKCKHW